MDMPQSRPVASVNGSSNGAPALSGAEKPLWQTPELVSLDIEETLGALNGNADPFFS